MLRRPPRSPLFSLHDALPISVLGGLLGLGLFTLIEPGFKRLLQASPMAKDRKSTRLNSSHEWISYAVFCLKKKNKDHLKTVQTVIHSLSVLAINRCHIGHRGH